MLITDYEEEISLIPTSVSLSQRHRKVVLHLSQWPSNPSEDREQYGDPRHERASDEGFHVRPSEVRRDPGEA